MLNKKELDILRQESFWLLHTHVLFLDFNCYLQALQLL